jgi:MipA family protein
MKMFRRSTAWRGAGCAIVAAGVLLAQAIASATDLPAPAAAPPGAPATYVPPAPDWIVTIGGELRVNPQWPGAPDGTFWPFGSPLFSIRKAGTPPDYFGPRDSFGFPIVDFGQFKLGPAAKLVWDRRASEDKALNGLGDVDYALQVGGFAEYWMAPWLRLRGEARQGFGGETGVTGDLFLDTVVPSGQFRFSAGPRLTVQSAAAVGPYFSITQAQSLGSTVAGLPALPVYHADGGLYSYGAGTQTEYFFDKQWAAHAFVEYERLTGSAADSPLVTQRGSPNQLTFGLGATYAFTMHQFW